MGRCLPECSASLFRSMFCFTNSPRKRGVLYTCFTSGYDVLFSHTYIDNSFDYVCFTDDKKLLAKQKSGVWQIRPLAFDRLDNPRNIRWHKILPHRLFPKYKLSIWIDTNIDVLTPKLFSQIDDRKLLLPRHFAVDCIYDECLRVIRNKKDTFENVAKVAELLVDEGMPKHYGMNENNIIIRNHHDPKVQKIMQDWWQMIKDYSHRDQLSLSYILWKNGVEPASISFENARADSENYFFMPHRAPTHF